MLSHTLGLSLDLYDKHGDEPEFAQLEQIIDALLEVQRRLHPWRRKTFPIYLIGCLTVCLIVCLGLRGDGTVRSHSGRL